MIEIEVPGGVSISKAVGKAVRLSAAHEGKSVRMGFNGRTVTVNQRTDEVAILKAYLESKGGESIGPCEKYLSEEDLVESVAATLAGDEDE